MNQFIAYALTEKVSSLRTIDYLKQRAANANMKDFDKLLDIDLQETKDLSGAHPEVMTRMRELAQIATQTLGNDAQQGSEQRPAVDLETSAPLILNRSDGK